LWWSWIYFIGFILVGTFVIFNLFIGVIVSNVEKSEKEEDTSEDDTKEELKQLRTEIKELKDLLNEQYNR
jgi:voltage-gated sodium channel